MASTIEAKYGSSGQAITCTLASLASGSARESASIDNTTNLFLDALVMLKLKTGSGTIGSDPYAYAYVAATVDNGTTWPDTVTGSDAAITLNSTTQLKLLGAVWLGATTTTYIGGPWSVAAAFGGALPQKWSIIVKNSCGVALDATEGNMAKLYQGVLAQTV